MAEPDAKPTRSQHADLSLAEIARVLPGAGPVMAQVSHLWGTCWYAAHGGNWDLAAFYFRRTRSELRILLVTRPKYTEQLLNFEAECLEPVGRALADHDLAVFQAAFQRGVERANAYHVETGYPYIRWRLPERSPEAGLDLGPPPPTDA